MTIEKNASHNYLSLCFVFVLLVCLLTRVPGAGASSPQPQQLKRETKNEDAGGERIHHTWA